jgi:hypothetical protein
MCRWLNSRIVVRNSEYHTAEPNIADNYENIFRLVKLNQ